jgi:hypothetical protein
VKKSDQRFYLNECHKHGVVRFYWSNRGCVKCVKAAATARYHARKAAEDLL